METKPATVAITTLGCKVNQCDSAAIAEQLARRGFGMVPFGERADCYIINTCVVTAATEAQSRQLIRRALRTNEHAQIIATGCYAQKDADALRTIAGRVYVAGNVEKKNLPQLVEDFMGGRGGAFSVSDIALEREFSTPGCTGFLDRTRAFLKVQDGCNSWCSYCIVPAVRGRSRSLQPDEALSRLRALADAGYREIVLTGIHLGAWGADLSPATDLTTFMRRIEQDEALAGMRLRISSLEPTEFTDGLIGLLAQSKRICPHFHIPLQSGDRDVLKAMKRQYTPELFQGLLQRLAAVIPDLNVGIDVIAGFPGETDAQFQNTAALLASLPAGYLHVFPYSRRDGTAAAVMPDQVAEQVKKERVRKLRLLSDTMKQKLYGRYVGSELEVLVESARDKQTGLLRGFSRNYIPMLFEGPDELMGTLQAVVVTEVNATAVRGVLKS